MALTLNLSILTARGILNDPMSVRYSQTDMLDYANDAIRMMIPMAPQLFQSVGDISCLGNETLQSVDPSLAISITDVRRVKGGRAITPMDSSVLSLFNPSWRTSPSASAISWSRVGGDPFRFELYPPSNPGQVVEVMYLRVPVIFSETDDTGLPIVYSGAIADYIVYRAEGRDDDHVISGRASQFLASFVSKVKGS